MELLSICDKIFKSSLRCRTKNLLVLNFGIPFTGIDLSVDILSRAYYLTSSLFLYFRLFNTSKNKCSV